MSFMYAGYMKLCYIVSFALLLPVPALAQETPNIASMFENFKGSFDALVLLIEGIAKIAGLLISVSAVLDLVKHNDGKVELKR